MYYYALLLNDGTVLRVSKSIDNLASTAVSLMPVMGILAVLREIFPRSFRFGKMADKSIDQTDQ
jgi:hypothetical protein